MERYSSLSIKNSKRLLVVLACLGALTAAVVSPSTAWQADWLGTPTSHNLSASGSSYGYTYWYAYAHFTSCAGRGYYAHWNPGFSWSGRGWFITDFLVPNVNAASGVRLRYKKTGGGDNGLASDMNQCSLDGWTNLRSEEVGNVSDWNGARVDLNENWTTCLNECGSSPSAVSAIRFYGDRWTYLNRWTIIGPYSSTALSNTNGLDEANLYLYPYVSTDLGNAIPDGLWGGKKPESYYPGDMNTSYSLNFGTRWNQNPNQAAYGVAWVYAPSGASPKFAIGSDDGCKVWTNTTLIHTNDVARGLARDQDVTGAKSLVAGWNRIVFKIQQGPGGGGWQGTISLRNGGDVRQNEPSVSYQADRYEGYSIFNEQDGWYPKMTLSNFNGVANPPAGHTIYTNNTTITASGTVTAQFIPFWKTMYYKWGNGVSGADGNYKPTTNSAATWSHSESNVTGHVRFHFFGVSKSGRTSGQVSGSAGGWTYNNSGACAWCDVYVDNVAPNNPSFSSANAASPTQVNLTWALPLDKGVGAGVTDGAIEATACTNPGDNFYRAGNVGVNVKRNGVDATGWTNGTSYNNTGLTPNTQYTYTIAARDNNGETRGAWHNTTGYVGSTSVYTLSAPPVANSITPSNATPCQGSSVVWTNNLPWGGGGIQYYRYAWDQSPTHTWTNTETQWTSGTLSLNPTAAGNWYLHIRGYNAANVANGNFDYSVTATATFSAGTITGGGGSACGTIDPGAMTYSGGSGGGALTYQWYSKVGTGGPGVGDTQITGATSASYDPPAGLTQTTTYNVLVTPTCGTAAFTSTPITVTVNPIPNAPTNAQATPSTIGPGGSSVLSATVGVGEEVVWYKGSCGGTLVTSPVGPEETTTYYAKAKNTTTGCASATCAQATVTYIPDDEGPELEIISVTDSETGSTGNFLKGTVTVEAAAADESGIAKVEYQIDDGDLVEMTLDQDSGYYVAEFDIDADWTNGQHSVTVIATDIYDNISQEVKDFTVNKNEVSGLLALQGMTLQNTSRDVTFVLNASVRKSVTLQFISGKAFYSFRDVDEVSSVSAKTAWNLRKKVTASPQNGQTLVDFTGSKALAGGDLNGDNVANALDYAILRAAWGYGAVGDITADGFTDNNDYLIMQSNWYKKGDPE